MPARRKTSRKRKRPCPFILGEAAEGTARARQEDEELSQEQEATEEEGDADEGREDRAGDDRQQEEGEEEDDDGDDEQQQQEEVPPAENAEQPEGAEGDEDEVEEVESTPSMYRRLQNDGQDAWPHVTAPYFPAALAVSADKPLEFNFDLFVYDGLPVSFDNVQDCREYCTRYASHALERGRQESQSSTSHPSAAEQERIRLLDKRAMFAAAGTSLRELMATRHRACDQNLDRVRRDRFGNVMVMGAPAWSDVCPNFMHGYPRRLVTDDHGGFLQGNICVAAKVSNQAMRSIAPGDVAAFCSRQALQNLGLTVSELFLARQSALSYSGQQKQPQRLVETMLRFGVDFLTFAPLSRPTLEKLFQVSHAVARRNLEFSPPSDDCEDPAAATSSSSSESSSDESIELDSTTVVSRLTQTERDDVQTESYTLQLVLLRHFVGRLAGTEAGTRAELRGPGDADGEEARPLRDAARAAARATSAASGSSRSGNARRRRKGRNAVQSADPVAGPSSAPQAAAPPPLPPAAAAAAAGAAGRAAAVPPEATLRERLGRIAGVEATRLPKAATLVPLRQFLSNHTPLARHDIEERSRRLLPGGNESTIAGELHGQRRTLTARRALQEVWTIARRDCTCLAGDADNPPSPSATPSETCPFKSSDGREEAIDPTAAACHSDSCYVCEFFAQHYQDVLNMSLGAGLDKAARLRALVGAASHLVPIVWSETFSSAEEQQRFKTLLQELLCCGQDKLNAVLSVGYLANIVPRIAQVHLTSGWSLFWREMRKVGNALQRQPTDGARVAVLQFLRLTCLSPQSPWAFFLTADSESADSVRALLLGDGDDDDDMESDGQDEGAD